MTYVGQGTWLAGDELVRFDQFDLTRGISFEHSDTKIVPQINRIHRTNANSVVLMKGSRWPGIKGFRGREGLTHKAPNVATDWKGNPVQLRLLLKVDIC